MESRNAARTKPVHTGISGLALDQAIRRKTLAAHSTLLGAGLRGNCILANDKAVSKVGDEQHQYEEENSENSHAHDD